MNRIRQWFSRHTKGLTRISMILAGFAASLAGFPVAFGMANEVTTTTLTLDEATEYISDKTLITALFQLAAYQFAEKFTLPEHEGRTFQVTRYETLNLPQNPLTQGTTPANTPMTINRVQAVSEQWGSVITMYDVPLLSIAHPVLQQAIGKLGEQAAKTLERETQRAMMGVTNNQWANAKASRDLLVATDVLTSLEIRKAVTNLRKNGAHKWQRSMTNTTKGYIQKVLSEGGGTKAAQPGMDTQFTGLVGIIDTDVAQDLGSDSTFVSASSYSKIRALHLNEIGMWLGVVWVESNFMPQITLLTSPTVAGANMTGFAGALSASTVYDIVVTRVQLSYGLEEAVSVTIATNTGGGNDSLSVALPAGATYNYRVYIGTSGGTKYLVTTASTLTTVAADDLTGPAFGPNQTIYVTSLPTTGDTAPVAPATGVTVHVNWIFGKEAFGCVELQKLIATLTPDQASISDPLKQQRKAGWKVMFKSVVLNNNYIRKIEAGSAFAG